MNLVTKERSWSRVWKKVHEPLRAKTQEEQYRAIELLYKLKSALVQKPGAGKSRKRYNNNSILGKSFDMWICGEHEKAWQRAPDFEKENKKKKKKKSSLSPEELEILLKRRNQNFI